MFLRLLLCWAGDWVTTGSRNKFFVQVIHQCSVNRIWMDSRLLCVTWEQQVLCHSVQLCQPLSTMPLPINNVLPFIWEVNSRSFMFLHTCKKRHSANDFFIQRDPPFTCRMKSDHHDYWRKGEDLLAPSFPPLMHPCKKQQQQKQLSWTHQMTIFSTTYSTKTANI